MSKEYYYSVLKGIGDLMKRVLIVDDQPGIRLLLVELFRRENHETDVASNGLEALQRVEDQQPDCVLLDMKMPGMDGIEVLKKLKSVYPELPVIVMTAYDESELTKEALEVGAVRYFVKPFDIFEVRDAVNALFQK